MAVWSLCFMLMLTGAVSQTVNYPAPVCAVKGSTVTLVCSFTPLQSVGRVQIKIIRVRWCQNHEICQGIAPSVYDSDSTNNDPRYKYLGDMKGNCTLQITDIQKTDDATFHFRMEATDSRGHFTETSGVKVTVIGAVSQTVNYYSDHICAVKGSTVTLVCTFTSLKSVTRSGREAQIKIIRVRWCQNHLICHGITPTVYDSDSTNNDPRYKYLGDKKGNCTLQITDIQKTDDGTFHFRMEANDSRGHFTGISGVNVTVIDGVQMKIKSSSGDRKVREGETVTLFCSAFCTFHQLEVTWFKDNHTLSESGPTLKLSPLTAKDSGNYSCGLRTNSDTRSPLYSLHVEADEEETNSGSVDHLLIVRLVLFALHTVLIIIVTSIIIKRTCWEKDSSRNMKNVTVKSPDCVEEL